MNIIFLDIDGVMRTDTSPAFLPDACSELSKLIRFYNAGLVIQSGWVEQEIHQGKCTKEGFALLFRTHGIVPRFFDVVCSEAVSPTRKGRILEWLSRHPETERYVVIDDNTYQHEEDGGLESLPFVHVNCNRGLTRWCVDEAVSILPRSRV